MLAVLFEAVAGVSRKPVWHAHGTPLIAAFAAAPLLVEQKLPTAESSVLVEPLPVAAVDARHSGFAGLTNNDEFQLTA